MISTANAKLVIDLEIIVLVVCSTKMVIFAIIYARNVDLGTIERDMKDSASMEQVNLWIVSNA